MQRNRLTRRALAVLILVFLPASLAGCAIMPTKSTSRDSAVQTDVYPAPAQDQAGAPAGGGLPERAGGGDETDRLIIRNKTLRLLVKSTADAVTEVTDLAKTHSGIVTDMQVATDTDEWLYRYDKYGSPTSDGAALRGWVTVRIPADSFDAFIAAVSEIGTVRFESESSSDVTQEHVDLSARLQNLRAQEARLRELVASAQNVTEVLAVERELERIRGEIESLDAQVKYLERQAAMATVTVELTEDRPVVRPTGDSWGFLEAITNGVRGAVQVLNFTISLLIATTPLWLGGLLIFFLVRSIVRRRRARRALATAPTAGSAAAGTAGTPDEQTAGTPAEPKSMGEPSTNSPDAVPDGSSSNGAGHEPRS